MEPIELTVLQAIHSYEEISQRDLSSQCGISLGTVNLLIKKFVQVGLIKIEQLNGKKAKYILTPKGFSVLSKKSLDYIARSYTAVLKVKSHIHETLSHHYAEGESVVIYGARDEIFAVLVEVLKEQGRSYKFIEELPESAKFVHWDGMLKRGIFLFGDLVAMGDGV